MLLLQDKEAGKSMAIVFFESEDDYRFDAACERVYTKGGFGRYASGSRPRRLTLHQGALVS